MSHQSAPYTRVLRSSKKFRTKELLKECQGGQPNKGNSNLESPTKFSKSQPLTVTSISKCSKQSRKLKLSKQTSSSTACSRIKSLKALEQPCTSKSTKHIKQLKSQKVSKITNSSRKTNQFKLPKLDAPTTSMLTKRVSCGDETAVVAKRSKVSGKINFGGGSFICSSTIAKQIKGGKSSSQFQWFTIAKIEL